MVGCQHFLMISGHSLHFELICEFCPCFFGIIGEMQERVSPDEPNSTVIVTRLVIPQCLRGVFSNTPHRRSEGYPQRPANRHLFSEPSHVRHMPQATNSVA